MTGPTPGRTLTAARPERHGPTPRARRRRLLVWLGLLGFVAVAAMVVWRRAYGLDQARAMSQLESRRSALESERASVARAVREATSRRALAPVAERSLGLRVPPDSLVVLLPVR